MRFIVHHIKQPKPNTHGLSNILVRYYTSGAVELFMFIDDKTQNEQMRAMSLLNPKIEVVQVGGDTVYKTSIEMFTTLFGTPELQELGRDEIRFSHNPELLGELIKKFSELLNTSKPIP